MNYVTSDIHGCRREFEALLKKIKFSSQDTLYIIGDMIDRGPDSMGVLKIMASNSNIYPVAGNHEFIMMSVLPRLIEYSCAVTPQVRQTGNRLSGLAGTAYASLLT